MSRRTYAGDLWINEIEIDQIVIDPHFEIKHGGTINDALILEMVKTLDGRRFFPIDVVSHFSYFEEDKIEVGGRLYKLIWLLEENQTYIGVVNAYRR